MSTSFTSQSTTPNILGYNQDGMDTGGQGWYDLTLTADPSNENILYVGGVNIWKSTNGGSSWTINTMWYTVWTSYCSCRQTCIRMAR